jgi:5-oxoprolinase (ATP-hydrolysing) subunit A
MSATSVMLESDLGEGFGVWSFGDDEGLLDVVDGANIACGFHAGDPMIMARTCAAAVARGVRIGAHVSYRDLVGFGRRAVSVPKAELVADVRYQLGALTAMAAGAGGEVEYVKAHGSLYNTAAVDADTASAVVEGVLGAGTALPIVCQPGTVMAHAAEAAGLPVLTEAFVDRAYEPSGLLVSRARAGSVVHDPAVAAERAVRMAREGTVLAHDGTVVDLGGPVAALCVHSDTPGARDIAAAVSAALTAQGLRSAASGR